MKDPFYFLAILRAFFYFWLAVEFIGIAMLYYWGYYRIKRTRIIGTMSVLFFMIGVFFSFLIVVSITGAIDVERYKNIVNSLYIIFIPLLFIVRRFREDSLRTEDGQNIEKVAKKQL